MQKALLIHPHELSKRWIDKMVSLKVTTLGLHPVGGPDADKSLLDLIERLKTPEFRALLDYAKEKGLKIIYELHALSYLLPRSEFERHPEWFRMDADGNRTPDMNLCVDSKEALDYIAARAVELADALYLSEPEYYFWLDDAKDAICHCDKCKDLSASDQQLIVLNRMVKELRIKRPEARLSYLAYFASITPPETVKPENGIFVEYAPYERDFTKPVTAMPQADRDNLSALLSYFGKENARVLEYWFDNSLFSHYTKPPQSLYPIAENVKADIAYYLSLGFADIATFACYLGDDYIELYGEPDLTSIMD